MTGVFPLDKPFPNHQGYSPAFHAMNVALAFGWLNPDARSVVRGPPRKFFSPSPVDPLPTLEELEAEAIEYLCEIAPEGYHACVNQEGELGFWPISPDTNVGETRFLETSSFYVSSSGTEISFRSSPVGWGNATLSMSSRSIRMNANELRGLIAKAQKILAQLEAHP
jgi:hypothetical protein